MHQQIHTPQSATLKVTPLPVFWVPSLCQNNSHRAASGAAVYPTGREERETVRVAGTRRWAVHEAPDMVSRTGAVGAPSTSELEPRCPLATQ